MEESSNGNTSTIGQSSDFEKIGEADGAQAKSSSNPFQAIGTSKVTNVKASRAGNTGGGNGSLSKKAAMKGRQHAAASNPTKSGTVLPVSGSVKRPRLSGSDGCASANARPCFALLIITHKQHEDTL